MFFYEILIIILNDMTLLYAAVKSNNIEMVKILLSNPKIDINAITIYILYFSEIFFNNLI